MITSWLFSKLKFDEDVVGYGYEDLLFAEKVKSVSGGILHIDNPVMHLGLESNKEFLHKTKNAVRNLAVLNNQGKLNTVRLTKFYNKLKGYGLLSIVLKRYKKREVKVLRKLENGKGNLRMFNLMKLYEYHIQLNQKK